MKKFFKNFISSLLLMMFWILSWWLFKIRNKTTIIGKENMPKKTNILLLSNHQSLIDSILIEYSLFSLSDVILHYKQVPWNAAAKENFFKKPSRRLLCYFLKTIPVIRKNTLHAANQQVRVYSEILQKSNLLLFFDGTRSRDGKIGSCQYGPAKLVLNNPQQVVIPIRVENMDKVMPIEIGYNWFKIKGGQNPIIKIGPPIKFTTNTLEGVQLEIKQAIEDL